MGQHYTLSTVEVSAWCNKCGKNTPHRVACKRLQYCIPCFDKSAQSKPAVVKEIVRQVGLFEASG
jgi:lauroyl/myristoyl acyltransferase